MTAINKERVEALDIAIMLMTKHLEFATPGGAGRESRAYQVAAGRIVTLQALRDELAKEAANDLQ